MEKTETTIDIEPLSLEGRAVLLGCFMLGGTLNLHCVQSKTTETMQVALDELVEKGFIIRDDSKIHSPGQHYASIKGVTREGAREVAIKHMNRETMDTDLPSFVLYEAIEGAPRMGGR